MCKEDELQFTMDFLTETIRNYLNQIILGKKFRGIITIEFNCIDGGIGSISTTVKKNYDKNELTEK
jgi:hypothetical protein